jgi:hypothetical protein
MHFFEKWKIDSVRDSCESVGYTFTKLRRNPEPGVADRVSLK